MKKIILIFVGMVNLLSAWEVTTHRAIDRTALMEVGKQNLKYFVDSVQISNEDYTGSVR